MDDIRVDIFGVKELNDLFEELTKASKKSIFQGAFKVAARPIIKDAKKGLNRTRYKKLKQSIGVKTNRYQPVLWVGARIYNQYKGYLGHIVNDGTDERFYKQNGVAHYTGSIKGNDFWNNAILHNREQVNDSIQKEVFESFERYIKRANKRRKSREH